MMNRKEIRLNNYNYSQEGVYFVTICSFNKEKLFCEIDEGVDTVNTEDINFKRFIKLTEIGIIITDAINNIENIYENISIFDYVIMPNHIHLLLDFSANPKSYNGIKELLKVIGGLKRYVTKEYNTNRINKREIWQKSFYEHIVRNEKEYYSILEYIIYNPLKWKLDEYYM